MKSLGLCRFHYQRHRTGVPLDAPRQAKSPKGMSAYDKVMAMSVRRGDCLEFDRAVDENGYGRIGIPFTDRSMLAHRAVMEHHHGESKLYVLHSCNNPPCVEIAHLRYGNQTANMRDAIASGTKRGRSLTDDEVAAIRADPRRNCEVAEEYGMHPSHVSKIRSGQRRR